MWEDLGAKAILAMGDTKGGIESAKDALARINAGKYNTFGEAMQGIKRNLTTGILLPLGDLVLPALKKFSTWITDNMPAIKNKIETVMSGVGTAFNIAIKVISNIVKGFIKFKVALIPIMAVVMAVIVNAWVVTTAKAVASAITQGIQSVKVMKAWIKTGVTATIHAIKQVAAWVMVGLGAIKSALITVAQSAIVVAKWIWMGVQALLHAAKQVAAWVLTGVGAIAAGVIMVAQAALMVAKWAFMGAQALIHAAKMAAAWIIALGPIGWAMIAIAALGIFIATHWEQVKAVTVKVFTAIGTFLSGVWDGIKKVFSVVGRVISGFFTEAWTKIKVVWSAVGGFFSGVWNGIKSVFSGIASWFRNIFQGAWTAIKNVFNGVGSFFGGIWNTIKSKFTSIGSAIGNAIGGAFKTVVNSIIRFAQNTINGFIRAINGAIGLINKIPGVEIGRVSTLSIPRLAKGGIVDSGQIYQAGEDGREVIMPLEKNTGWIDNLANKLNYKSDSNGTGGLNVTIENFVNNRKQDIQALAEELEFYRKQAALGR